VIEDDNDKPKASSKKKKKKLQRPIDSGADATPTEANPHSLPPQPQLNNTVQKLKIEPNISNAPRGPRTDRQFEGMSAQAKNRRIEIETKLKGHTPIFGWNLQTGEPWMCVRFQANNLKVAYSKESLTKLNTALAKQNLKLRAINFTWHVLAWPEFTRNEFLRNSQDLERLSELRGMLEEESEIKGAAEIIDGVWENYKFRAVRVPLYYIVSRCVR
jgi:hypothetical protein